MNQALHQVVWQASRIAFLLTDDRLVVREMHGLTEIIDGSARDWRGSSLLEVFPELLGSQQELEEILRGRSSGLRLEYVNRETGQGRTRYLTMEDRPWRDETGSITGILHLVQDVTRGGQLKQQVTHHRNQLQLLKEQIERRNLDLVAANTELRRLGELKSQFISVAAHELRNPLTSLNGYVEMLIDGQMGTLSASQQEVLAVVEKSGLRLLRLTDQLLSAARLEAGQIDLLLQPMDLTGLVKEVISEYVAGIETKALRLDQEFSPGLPPALCDENWTRQIVSNLLSNAVKFTPERGTVSIRVGPAAQPGYVQLSVADTGVGIPAGDQANIFSRWYRAQNASTVNTQGSGLGLYITHALVALHNGSIWLESRPGQGSTFHVTLPIAG